MHPLVLVVEFAIFLFVGIVAVSVSSIPGSSLRSARPYFVWGFGLGALAWIVLQGIVVAVALGLFELAERSEAGSRESSFTTAGLLTLIFGTLGASIVGHGGGLLWGLLIARRRERRAEAGGVGAEESGVVGS